MAEAKQQDEPDIEVTPEMIEAGVLALCGYGDRRFFTIEDTVESLLPYRAPNGCAFGMRR